MAAMAGGGCGLAVRNLTARAVVLVSIEVRGGARRRTTRQAARADHRDGAVDGGGALAAVGRAATGVWNATVSAVTWSNATAEEEQMDMVKVQEVDQRIEPSDLLEIDVSLEAGQVVDLLFEIIGAGRYTARIPGKQHSDTLRSLDGAQGEYHTIYTSERDSQMLTILPATNLSRWMTPLDPATPLSRLSLPGTHNSSTHYTALPSVRCQRVPLSVQLANGIRFLDIRLQPPAPSDTSNTNLTLVHGAFPISFTGAKYFADVVRELAAFLRQNPGETVICSIKREGVGTHTDAQLAALLRTHYFHLPSAASARSRSASSHPDLSMWYLSPTVPTLAQARGKLVLLRRFALDAASQQQHGGRGLGIDAAHWTHNARCDVREHVVVQDLCEVLVPARIADKVETCCAFLRRCAAVEEESVLGTGARRLHVSFLSASNFWNVGCWPDRIAGRLNPAVLRYLCAVHGLEAVTGHHTGVDTKRWRIRRGAGHAFTGILVCDWVGGLDGQDWDLVRCIIALNAAQMQSE